MIPSEENQAAPQPLNEFAVETTIATENTQEGVRQLLRAALSSNTEITIDLDRINEADDGIWKQIEILSRAMGSLTRGQSKLYPIVGKVFLYIQDNPDIFKAMGYKDFSEFIKNGVEESLGMSRATVYRAMQMSKNFPTLTPNDVGRIGTSNVYVMSKMFANDTNPAAQALIEQSRTMEPQAFRSKFREIVTFDEGLSVKRDPVIMIQTTPEIANMWKRFIEDPDIQEFCKSDISGYILKCMIEECEADWVAQVNERRRNPSGDNLPEIDMDAFMRD